MTSNVPGKCQGLLAVHVFGQVLPGNEDAFAKLSANNASGSVLEPGVARFDFLTGQDDPSQFLLIEVYKSNSAPAAHKETAHYNAWREGVTDLMAQARTASKYHTIFPPPHYWDVEPSASRSTDGDMPSENMLAVLVDVQVMQGFVESFVAATVDNCSNSIREGGISRFDLVQNTEDPCNFVLVEVYNSPQGPAAHKATAHYARWRDTVEDMMYRPRTARKFVTRFPSRVHWHRTELAVHRTPISAPASAAFEFVSAGRIVFGCGVADSLPQRVKGPGPGGKKVLLVVGATGAQRYGALVDKLKADGAEVTLFAIAKEPSVSEVRAGVKLAREAACTCVVALGGGSVIDAGKAISALATNPGEVEDYLEVVGRGQKITVQPLPLIAVPTTAGTGSEVTKNAVIKSEEHNQKVSIRSDLMLPSVALIDPLLTVSSPPHVTAHAGLDALTQCIEPYVSHKGNPFTGALAKEGMLRAARSLRRAYRDGNDLGAREDMAVASVLGGLALANAKLGAVHGFAGVIGGLFEVAPHGAVCAALLPHCFSANVQALSKAEANSQHQEALERHAEVARIITGSPTATPAEGAAWLQALAVDLGVPSLSAFGIKPEDFETVVDKAATSSSMQGNPVKLNKGQLMAILQSAM